MLVLSRQPGETVFIGGRQVSVTVLKVHGDKVRLAFNAPADVPIHRAEVQERVDQEQEP